MLINTEVRSSKSHESWISYFTCRWSISVNPFTLFLYHRKVSDNWYNPLNCIMQYQRIRNSDLLWVTHTVARSKLFHQSIDFLSLSWQPKSFQKSPKGGHKVHFCEVQLVHISIHNFFVKPERVTILAISIFLPLYNKNCDII